MKNPELFSDLYRQQSADKLNGAEQIHGFPEEETQFIKTIEQYFGDSFRANLNKMEATQLGRLVRGGRSTTEAYGVLEHGIKALRIVASDADAVREYGVVIRPDSTISFIGQFKHGEKPGFVPARGVQAAQILRELNALPWDQMQTPYNPVLAKKL